ncbi:MAG: ribulose-phosphate 3-epimerase [Deltaproteobacteria bacterium]|nr:ribulose-phosphate 3-epimerase [Deltaproteobacteria bacterium]
MSALGDELARIEAGGADWVHVDVMDGRFVPNISLGIPVVASLRGRTRMPLDVHLMIVEPERYVEAFVAAGADILTVQAEASRHLYRTLASIRDAGARAGVSLNPATPLLCIEHVLELVDLVLVMTVEPGFGGQAFIPAMLPKIEALAGMLEDHKAVDIQVDGGINTESIGLAARAGANVFVAGTSVFGVGNPIEGLRQLREALARVRSGPP